MVRCHYGVTSLAAMAAHGLTVFENAEEILGTDIGFHRTGYVVGVGEANTAALRASLAAQRAVGVTTEEIDRSEVARLWPTAHLDDFAAFAWEERGGHGDAYRTAQAFAAAARRAGGRVRQNAAVAEILVERGRVTGVRLTDGSVVSTPTVVLAAGPWSAALLRSHGIDLPITVHREQIVLVDPGTDLGPVPVFSDLVSLQYVRPETSGHILFGNSDLATLHPADPTPTPTAPTTISSNSPSPRCPTGSPASPAPRWPRRTPAATTSPRTSTRSSPRHPSTASSWPPGSADTASRSHPPSANSSPTSSSTAEAAIPPSPQRTSGCRASPREHC